MILSKLYSKALLRPPTLISLSTAPCRSLRSQPAEVNRRGLTVVLRSSGTGLLSLRMAGARSLGTAKQALAQPGSAKKGSAEEVKPGAGAAEAADGPSSVPGPPQTTSAKLKQAVKDYGATVIVFHVTMSLCSLGFFYLLVTSGLDIGAILQKFGIDESIFQNKITQGASTFVIAYAVHKVFAPFRLAITLTATPFIVRKLRHIGILKKPVA